MRKISESGLFGRILRRINFDYYNLAKEIPLLIKVETILAKKGLSKNNKWKRVLIVDISLIGDSIASLPALKHFIDEHNSKIDLIVSPLIKPLAEHIKGVDRVFSAKSFFNKAIEKKSRISLKNYYDMVVLMRLSKDSYKALENIEFNSIKTYTKPYLGYILHLLRNLPKKSKIKQWSELNYEIIGLKNQKNNEINFGSAFSFKKQDYYKVSRFLKRKNSKRIVIHTGSGWPIKLWGNRKWIKLLKKIRKLDEFDFIFVGGTKEEEEDFNFIRDNLGFEAYSVIKKFNLKDIALLMRKCDYFIGIDSGPRHIAHLVDLPSINLLGPGPKFFKPLNKNAVIIDKSDCVCANLLCYRKKTCIQKISVEDVFKEFKKIYRKRSKH